MSKIKWRQKHITSLMLVLATFITLVTLTMCSQNKIQNKKEAIYSEIDLFITDSVIPQMNLIREELDLVLTDDEKNTVDELREKAKAITEEGIQLHVKYANQDEDESYELSESEIQSLKKARKETRKIITACWTILDNHENDFDDLYVEMYPEMVSWHVSLMKNISEHIPFHRSHGKRFSKLHKKGHVKNLEQVGGGIMMPVFLLLYEPTTNFPISVFQDALQAHKKIEWAVK